MRPTRVIERFRYLPAVLATALLLAACGTTSVRVADGEKRYPPTEAVDVLYQPPQRAYETLAKLEAQGGALPGLPADEGAVLRSLGNKAKALGADAVIITDRKATVTRRGLVYRIQGTAIKYRTGTGGAQAEPMPAGQPVQVESVEPAGDGGAGTPAAEPAPAPQEAPKQDWLSRQPPDFYTIQLLAARQPESLRRFIEEHGLGDETGQITLRRNGELWHVLVYGTYPTKAAAREAIRALPPSLRRARPWARRIGDLQAQAGG